MAYAAVVSLMQILENILGEQYQIPWGKQQIESLLESMRCFDDFLGSSWKKRSPDAVHFFAENEGNYLWWSKIISQDLKLVVEEIESIQLKVTCLEDSWASAGDHDTMVGFKQDSLQLMDRILGQSKKLQVVPVVGMGGIGKTTLVKNVFQDKSILHHFDVAAWVTVSQNYRKRDILLGLIESTRRITYEMPQESDEELSECVYKCLKGRRYLIVMDGIWHTEAWEEIYRLFPDDNMGSRVLLTTRQSDVFGDKKSFPAELKEVGMKIARNCKGIPLSIVVISGLLSKVARTLEEWESIAKNLSSVLLANDGQWAELLHFSYDHLSHHLKACFLYTGVFPLDLEIPISKLIKLWIAEGFIKQNSSKSLEEVAEEYFDDLMSRNLILVGEKRFHGRIKTCAVHDLLREWCLSKALEQEFIHTLNANIYKRPEIDSDPQRLFILEDSSNKTGAEILGTRGTFSLVRSLLSQCYNPHDKLRCCKLLRVLDLSKVDLGYFPRVILELIHLKYVSVCCKKEREIYIPKYLPDSLRNLQTLIIDQLGRYINSSVYLPPRIWSMQHLRHLRFGTCHFPHPREGDKNPVLENLQTLSYVSASNCTEEFIQGIQNVKKLGIRFQVLNKQLVVASSLRHLGKLHKLETLKCVVEPRAHYNILEDLILPPNLKKLSLRGTRISWTDVSIIGSLPNLEVLKLKEYACEGSEWEPIEGEFCRLKCLLIDGTDLQHWRAGKDHFPILERLILFDCPKLEEIPLDFVYSDTLESIELDDASQSAVTSARRIQEGQEDVGNEVLKVRIYDMWEYISQKRKKEIERRGIQAEEEEYLYSYSYDSYSSY
ncbi:putative late blight resistance protein homolog R1A-10 [Henckelia pumila]|uniref:putative late blight resistance protein homolog R1A-10 n=1 Tax=Henckelia pumila TaxID=405737 RepID=UPI003C6E27C3